jgi:hypothetical protein
MNFNSDQSRKISFNAGAYYGFGDKDRSDYKEFWAGINLRPMNSLSISIDPSFGYGMNELQYINTLEYENKSRYIFSRIDQKTLAFTVRLDFTLTPDLTIQYYGQPFVSSGEYANFKHITVPYAQDFSSRYSLFSENQINFNMADETYEIDENLDGAVDYSFGKPDFNFREFRSNLVLRWEYSRGSTIYLVWSQGRSSSSSNGTFDFGNDMDKLFGVKAHHVFLIKVNYWFSL